MAEMLKSEYTVTAGSMVKGLTLFVIAMFIAIAIFTPLGVYYTEKELLISILLLILVICIFIPIIIGSWAYSPQKYIVTEKGITIVRPYKPLFIPIKEITEVEDKEIAIFKTVQLGANGGLFSLSGAYYNKTDGKFWMYAKNDKYVMIHAAKKYVLSPDDKERFIIELKSFVSKYGKQGDRK
jgi:hypothetical protein